MYQFSLIVLVCPEHLVLDEQPKPSKNLEKYAKITKTPATRCADKITYVVSVLPSGHFPILPGAV